MHREAAGQCTRLGLGAFGFRKFTAFPMRGGPPHSVGNHASSATTPCVFPCSHRPIAWWSEFSKLTITPRSFPSSFSLYPFPRSSRSSLD